MNPFENAWIFLKAPWERFPEGEGDETGRDFFPTGQDKVTDDQRKAKRIHMIDNNPEWVVENLLDSLYPSEIERFEGLHGRLDEISDDRRHPDSRFNLSNMENIPSSTGREEVPGIVEPSAPVGVLGAAEDPAEEEEIPPSPKWSASDNARGRVER
jgi:hypothetical protein